MKPFALKSPTPYSGLIGTCLFGLCFGSDSVAQLQVPYGTGATWESAPNGVSTGGALADIDYHGHLSVGDIDRDGFLDVAVAVFLGPGGFGTKGGAKAYFNQGGTLESTPSWTATDASTMFGNTVTWADVDGDLELGVTDNN